MRKDPPMNHVEFLGVLLVVMLAAVGAVSVAHNLWTFVNAQTCHTFCSPTQEE